MHYEVLGPVRVRRDGVEVALSGSLRCGLLAVLLVNANRPVPVDTLVAALWADSADAGPHRLQLLVHKLRRALGDPDRLTYEAGAYTLRVDDGELDADRFAALAGAAEQVADVDPGNAVVLLREALGLWRGEPFQGLDLPVLAGEAQRLGEARLAASEALYGAELRQGRHTAVVAELADLVRENPLRERLSALLMTALYRGGRRADALAVYRDTRTVLVEELGLEPGPELRELERAILAGEPVAALAEIAPAHAAGVPYGPEAASPTPAELPHVAAVFMGRDAELAELTRVAAADGAARVVAVTGTAGVGKTAMAVRWARQAESEFPDGQLYVDLRGYGPDRPVPVDEALAQLLRGLGLEYPAIAADPAERAAQFRTLISGRRALVVLDNAVSAEQVRPMLPGSASCFVLITSRDSLRGLTVREGAHRIDLNRLTEGVARQLMADLLGGVLPDAAIELVVRACAGLPLALRIAAERLRERHGELDDLLAELSDEQTRLDLLDTGDDPQSSVRSVFSWSYRDLSPDAARLFRLWALHPGTDSDADALDALAGTGDLRATRRHLDTLLRARLADRSGAGRYQVHDLLRAYAAELTRSQDSADDRTAALARLNAYYVHAAVHAAATISPPDAITPATCYDGLLPVRADHAAAMRWLEVERSNLLAVADVAPGAGQPFATTDLSRALWRYLDLSWYADGSARLHGRALATARDSGDRSGEAWALTGLGLLDHRLKAPAAADRLAAAARLHEELGDANGQAVALNYLATVEHHAGRVEEAVATFERAIAVYDETGAEAGLARPLNNLAMLHRTMLRYDEAATCAQRALELAERTGNLASKPHSLRELCLAMRGLRRLDDALRYGLRSLRVVRESGIRRVEGMVLCDVGSVYADLGDVERAADYHRQADEVAERIGSRELRTYVLVAVGDAHRTRGDAESARAAYEEALVQGDGVHLAYIGDALTALGKLSDEAGDGVAALGYWRRAIEAYDALNRPEAGHLRRVVEGVGAPE